MQSRHFGLNLSGAATHAVSTGTAARVAFFSLASDSGCQIAISNDPALTDYLSLFDLVYWNLLSSAPCPADYDVAVVEGAVCSPEHVELLKRIRAQASIVIALGTCAVTGGVCGLVGTRGAEGLAEVYGQAPDSAAGFLAPRPVISVIDVDFRIPGCPVESAEFVSVMQRALLGSQPKRNVPTLCGSCKASENVCFYERGRICLGLVTRSGCGAHCVTEGHPCIGCRGIARNAQLDSAREIVARTGLDVAAFDAKLELFNHHTLHGTGEEADA